MRLVRILFLCSLACGILRAQGSVLLVGGGSENYNDWSDQPYRWLVDHAPNKKILVMHYSTTSSWLPGYFVSLGATSATNLVVSSSAAANDSDTYRSVLSADGIFLRGGDQWQYVSRWKGTLVEKAIKEVFLRGGIVGGSSAGEAVLSKVIFDSRLASVDPRTALRNPLSSGITFTDDFLGLVPGILADTHFFERGRLGRLLAMVALYKQQTGLSIVGVGVDYNTALAVTSDGVGEVMGSGTVTILRLAGNSTFTLQTNAPLRMSNVRMDQLTAGFRISLTNGAIQSSPAARPFVPKLLKTPASLIILDGSGSASDWYRSSGSVARFVSLLQPNDTVGIISSPSAGTPAVSLDSCLKARTIASRLLWIDDAVKNDVSLSRAIGSCGGFAFVANNLDSVAGFLSNATLAGKALASRTTAGKPLLFLSNDARLVSDSAVSQTEQHPYAAYYGYLKLASGIGVVAGIELMPRLYETFDYIDNRTSGFFWGMGQSRMPFGILFDSGTYLSMSDKTVQVYGATPAIVVDASGVQTVDFPTFRDPGKANPRQNAALIGAVIHVVADSQAFSFRDGTVVSSREPEPTLPSRFDGLENYPNPFNPSTTIEFHISKEGRTTLTVFDLQGKKVATLFEGHMGAGTHSVRWNAQGFAAGMYLARLFAGGTVVTQKLLLVK